MSQLPPAIFLMGPTASGKTDLAIELARLLPCELVSVDSALVYRGMDIGTAKPAPEVLQAFPHRLVDICEPSHAYSAAEFRADALQAMADISARGKIPLLVGGTMLYFKALLDGLAEMPAADPQVRAELEAWAAEDGLQALHQQLAEVDPQSAARIHPTDPQRLIRALEVYRVSGMSMTRLRERQVEQDRTGGGVAARLPYTVAQLAIAPARQLLHERIARRFLSMIEQGLIAEVEGLRRRPDLHAQLPSMRSVGYRQVWEYLDGQTSRDQMIERGIIATRQLAKRQCTWLRSWSGLQQLDSENLENPSSVLKYLESVTILA